MDDLTSDNTSAMASELLEALRLANSGSAASYAADEWTSELQRRLSHLFERECAIFITATGTAANALSIAALCPPWKRALCHRFSHIMENESGAPEALSGGGKLHAPPRASDRINAEDLRIELARHTPNDPHTPHIGLVTLSQATESGTIYRAGEIGELSAIAHAAGAGLHIDGARFANALVTLNIAPGDASWKLGCDGLSLGVAKNGGAIGDLIVLFDLERAEEFRYRQMRAGHLIAKNRFAAAQMLAYFEDDLWLNLAASANAMSIELARRLSALGLELAAPVEANEVFVLLPPALVQGVQATGRSLKLVGPERFAIASSARGDRLVARFVTSWNTRIETLAALADDLARHVPA